LGNVGDRHVCGLNVKKDPAEATKLCGEAAATGNEYARRGLPEPEE